ncbi:RHS repeat-associated core domain-containing protein [Stenotrophomonas rhizophila]|uniref:RHS repeat-associated core domain-containing protein n=1 Tax=Stenotrophomonas rhizophila TaxID=216778 RepID=UPI003D188D81
MGQGPEDSPDYTGHVSDPSTGLTCMQQRYYDSDVGSHLSVDPVTAASNPVELFSRYRYADSNPSPPPSTTLIHIPARISSVVKTSRWPSQCIGR